MPTKYEQLYELQIRLKTAQFKLRKAQERVRKIEEQIAQLSGKDGWDVT